MIAKTPKPPYYAVIFTSIRTEGDLENYGKTAQRMLELATEQTGFLGYESARNEIGITVSYWTDLAAVSAWKRNTEHITAKQNGREKWYESYKVRICRVEREYGFEQGVE